MGKRPVSIYDVARIAGVSTATVSNILNEKGSYSDKTRALVLEVARREGYVANFAARNLRSSATKTVGLITPDVSNDFFSTIVLGVEGRLNKAGYTSFVCNTAHDAEREDSYVRDLISKQVDGLVYIGGSTEGPIRAGADVPVIHIDHAGKTGMPREVFVGNDMRSVVNSMTRTLHARGCRHMALVSVSASLYHAAENSLTAGYFEFLKEQGLRLDKNLLLEGAHEQKSYLEAEELVGRCLDEGFELDGIVALGDRVALGAVRALKARGIAVGQDVRVIGMDDSIYSRISDPAISTVNRRTGLMAEKAADALLALICGKDAPETHITVDYEVVERSTTLGA